MYKVLLFAGTIEGRTLAEFLRQRKIPSWVCVATEYGGSLIEEDSVIHVSHERLDEQQMEALMVELDRVLVVDATHPYAAEVTGNIRRAAERAGCEYLRLLREGDGKSEGKSVYVESTVAAADWLNGREGAALLTTGSKELAVFTKVKDFEKRLYARVLSLPKVAEQCANLGFTGNHLICMQGPFSREMNAAMIRQYGIRYLVTKDTGTAGGFPEKEEAALETGITLVVIGRPVQEVGLSLLECKHELCRRFEVVGNPRIALVGIGMGGRGGLSCEAEQWCRESELLIGASRMTEGIALNGQVVYSAYQAGEIKKYIDEHPEFDKISILLSGDVGFYSGAKKLLELLPEDTTVFPGTASLVAFCAKLKESWEDAALVSAHGKNCNLVGEIQHHEKVFSLLGKGGQVKELCGKLLQYGMDDVEIAVGERLSYPEERILRGHPGDFLNLETDPLAVILVKNNRVRRSVTHGLPDEAFLRDKVPMTKEEVREVSICKLHLQCDSIVYDVGAGSGSLSVEMALTAYRGKVYAIEKKPEAVGLLRKNRQKFGADNMEIVEGYAPEALEELPAPTHAFIGGSSGNLKEICELLLKKNPEVRLVMNAITLETVGEALQVLKELPVEHQEIVQMTVSRSKEVGRYHMMMGQNPVYIISCGGGMES